MLFKFESNEYDSNKYKKLCQSVFENFCNKKYQKFYKQRIPADCGCEFFYK